MDLTIGEVMADLEYGRTREGFGGRPMDAIRSLPRPTLGGGAFARTYLAARVLGAVHPRLARAALLRLWFTPWVHPSALAPVSDVPTGLTPWSHAVDGTHVHGFHGGAGQTVVLLHGWSGRAADMRHLAGDLVGAGLRVVAPDLPAHGLTTGDRTDLFTLAQAVGSVLEHERPTVVVAHSMGFPALMLALEAGAPAPARVVAIAPGRKMLHALDAFAHRAHLGQRLVSELRRGIEARFGAGVWQTLDVDRVLPELEPVGLVVHDEGDDEVSVSDARRIAAAWPRAELVETTGLGHRRILRDTRVRRRVVDWIGSVPSSGTGPGSPRRGPGRSRRPDADGVSTAA